MTNFKKIIKVADNLLGKQYRAQPQPPTASATSSGASINTVNEANIVKQRANIWIQAKYAQQEYLYKYTAKICRAVGLI